MKLTKEQQDNFAFLRAVMADNLSAPIVEVCTVMRDSAAYKGLPDEHKRLLIASAVSSFAMGVVEGYFDDTAA